MDRLRMEQQQQHRLTPTRKVVKERGQQKGTLNGSAKGPVRVSIILSHNGNERLKWVVKVDSPDTTVVSRFPILVKVDMRCANKRFLVQRRSHFCTSDRRTFFGRWSHISHRDRFSTTTTGSVTASKDRIRSAPSRPRYFRRPRPTRDR